MNSKRAFYVMCGLILFFLLAMVGGSYEIDGLLTKQSQKLVNAKTKLASLQQQQTELARSKKDIIAYSDLYNISRTIVPENKNQAEAVRQIVNLAARNGVNIGSITFPPSTLGSSPSAASTTTNSSAAALGGGPSAAGGTNPSLSQLVKVTNVPGVYVLQLTVSSATGNNGGTSYSQLINFLASLEQNRLTALVSRISISPLKSSSGATSTNAFSFELSLNIYIKP